MRDSSIDAPQEAQPIYRSDGLGRVVTGANILVSGILIAAIYFDNRSATIAALSGVGYFAVSTSLTLLTLSGTLTHIVTNAQDQKTMRQLHQLQHHAQLQHLEHVKVVDPVRLDRKPPTEPMQLHARTSFVAPHGDSSESAKREAYAWLMQLYGADGDPDPKKVLMKSDKERPGRVRVAAPSRPAKQWLMDHSILLDLGGTGFRLNLVRCPTISAAQTQLSLANGVGGSLTTLPEPTTTPESGGVL